MGVETSAVCEEILSHVEALKLLLPQSPLPDSDRLFPACGLADLEYTVGRALSRAVAELPDDAPIGEMT